MAGTLSGGEQQMLAISRALAGETRCSCSTRSPWASLSIIVAHLYELVGAIAAVV